MTRSQETTITIMTSQGGLIYKGLLRQLKMLSIPRGKIDGQLTKILVNIYNQNHRKEEREGGRKRAWKKWNRKIRKHRT